MKSAAKTMTIVSLLAAAVAGSGCGADLKEWAPERERVGIAPVYRQVPPQPVYNRLRWVHLPEVLPVSSLSSSAPAILPVFHLVLKNATLEDAAHTLAAMTRFDSYCSSSLADRKITIDRLGTLDELAAEIAVAAGITVQIDRASETVRFLPKMAPVPEFWGAPENGQETPINEVLNNEVSLNEHQSIN